VYAFGTTTVPVAVTVRWKRSRRKQTNPLPEASSPQPTRLKVNRRPIIRIRIPPRLPRIPHRILTRPHPISPWSPPPRNTGHRCRRIGLPRTADTALRDSQRRERCFGGEETLALEVFFAGVAESGRLGVRDGDAVGWVVGAADGGVVAAGRVDGDAAHDAEELAHELVAADLAEVFVGEVGLLKC
jgi:hypothetical protein